MSIVSYQSCNMFFLLCLAGILEIRTVSEGGILAIKGVKSQYYISMNKAGQLQGKVIFFLSEISDHPQSSTVRIIIGKHPFQYSRTKN